MFIFAIFMDSQQHNGLYRARLLCEIHLNISDQCIVLHKGPADGFVSLILGFRRDSQKSNFKIKFSILSSRLADALMILWLLAISRYKHLPGPHTRHNFPHYQTLVTAGQYWPRPAGEAVITAVLQSPIRPREHYSQPSSSLQQFVFKFSMNRCRARKSPSPALSAFFA